MRDFNIPEDVLNQISINNPVYKYDNYTYILVPTGVKDIYEILRREDDWLDVQCDYINYTTCEQMHCYKVKDGRIFKRDAVKNAISELKKLLINDLIADAKHVEINWNEMLSESELRSEENLTKTEIAKYFNRYYRLEETTYDYVFLRTKSLAEALEKRVDESIFRPKAYYNKDYEYAIINIALLWISNQISTKTAIERLHKLSTIIIVSEVNAESVKNKRLQLVEAVKIILDFYNDIPKEIQAKKDLHQYLIEHEVKTVNVKTKNREEKVRATAVIRTLNDKF